MRIFEVVVTTIILGAFRQRIQKFLWENIFGGLFRHFSHNHIVRRRITGFEFEVFLCFLGEDIQKGFTGLLYEGLQQRGISTFKDDVNLDKEKEIDRLLEYIEKSKIFVPIFSQHYADSKWCLKEVTKSVECGKQIFPIFFGVDPSDVRNLRGPFKFAFKKHESNKALNQEEVKKWGEALKIVGNLSGFTLKENNGDEIELKQAIIKRVLNIVNDKPLQVAKHPIGLETRVEEVKRMLENIGDESVRVIGIYGMPGLGKTTIAKAVYNELAEGFSGATSFLSDVRKNASQPNELVALQKQVFHQIFKDENINFPDAGDGATLINKRANKKKVLLVLDDVDSTKQIDALVGERDWFGSGSVIIITTRDKKVLVAHNVKEHEIYEPAVLNEEQSRKLFLQQAFNGIEPEGDYLQLSKEVVATAAGLPLTLEVLGSLLTCDTDVQEWKYTLEELKKIPHQRVQQTLKLSYDRLDIYEQKIFLDISCLFIGRSKQYATYMWEDCGWFPDHSIKVLEERSFIKIDEKSGEFWMHDQIRDMGRAIVKKESSQKVEKQSRLWNPEDSFSLLQRKVPATIAAEGIQIIPGRDNIISAECFQNMPYLRYFHAEHLNFQDTLDCFPRDLKWLELSRCQFDSPPSDHLNLGQLIILQLYETNYIYQILVNQLRFKAFEKLKVLKIDDPTIKISPNFINIPCLVELSLSRLALITIDESIGKLKDLAYLEIRSCRQLEKLPDSIGSLSSLEVLSVTGCDKIMSLPEQLGDIGSLRRLDLSYNSGIKNLPDSISQLSWLESLNLSACRGFSSLPERLGHVDNLRELFLDSTQIEVIPDSVGQLKSLKQLSLRECHHLCSLPERLGDVENLRELILDYTQIEVIPDSVGQLKNLKRLSVKGCRHIKKLSYSIKHLVVINEFIGSSFDLIELSNQWYKYLKYIELIDDDIKELPHCIKEMKNLKKLSLSCKMLVTLPNWMERLSKNLTELSVNSKHLTTLPDSVGQLKNLERLSLKDCYHLRSLPKSLGDMENLRELFLDNTEIEVIPDSIGHIKNLERLSLKRCDCLCSLPESLGDVENLRELFLDCTKVEVIPDSVGLLKNLERLSLSACLHLGCLPERLGDVKNLRELILYDTEIEVIPDSVGLLKNLERLSLSACLHFHHLPEKIGDLENLRELFLDCTEIEVIPDSVVQLRNLELLSLEECCHLHSLPEKLGDMKNLRELFLDNTKIEVIPDSVGQLKNLERLSLKRCHRLCSLPERLGDVENLKELFLDKTEIEVIPDSVGQLKNLERISMQGCRYIKKFPSSITHLAVISEFTGSSFDLIELSNPSYKVLKDIHLIDDGIKELPDCIKEMENLKKLSLSCEMLITLPNWIEQLFESLTELSVNSKHLAVLPDCVEKLYQLENLSLECKNLSIFPDLLERLENLMIFSLKSKNLKHLPATIHESWGKLVKLDLSGCENLEELTATTSIQQKEQMTHLSSLQYLYLDDCKRLEYLPQLPSSLSKLSASACTNLQKISVVSNLKRLTSLDLKGCKLLENVPGLENISNNLRELQFPGPCHLMECCSFSRDFKNKVFKEMTFASLHEFGMSGYLETGSLTGQQQIHFMIPRLPFDWLESGYLRLKLEKIDSPVHVKIKADDVPVFKKSLELSSYVFSGEISLSVETLVNIGGRCETTAEASQLQKVDLFLSSFPL